jgi:hypothetical protein
VEGFAVKQDNNTHLGPKRQPAQAAPSEEAVCLAGRIHRDVTEWIEGPDGKRAAEALRHATGKRCSTATLTSLVELGYIRGWVSGLADAMRVGQSLGNILSRLFVWGWCIYDAEFGEGVDGMWQTRAEAEAYANDVYGPEREDGVRSSPDGGEYDEVEIFPGLSLRKVIDEDNDPIHRLTDEEIAALGVCEALGKPRDPASEATP